MFSEVSLTPPLTYHMTDHMSGVSANPVLRTVEGVSKMSDVVTRYKSRVVSFVIVWSQTVGHLFWEDITVIDFLEVALPPI